MCGCVIDWHSIQSCALVLVTLPRVSEYGRWTNYNRLSCSCSLILKVESCIFFINFRELRLLQGQKGQDHYEVKPFWIERSSTSMGTHWPWTLTYCQGKLNHLPEDSGEQQLPSAQSCRSQLPFFVHLLIEAHWSEDICYSQVVILIPSTQCNGNWNNVPLNITPPCWVTIIFQCVLIKVEYCKIF